MKLPAKIEYAVRAVLELALRSESGKPVPLDLLVKTQQIPAQFLVQLLSRLKHAGLVETVRGVAGGYALAKHPSKITLADVFRTIDSHILELPKPSSRKVDSEAARLFSGIWTDISCTLSKQLEVTLEELTARLRDGQLTYQI
ncbi:MAG: Rrf2 family transcriptional regulator [Candidatus Omnitrophota bacterium]